MRISDWSSDVCASDLVAHHLAKALAQIRQALADVLGEAALPGSQCSSDLAAGLQLVVGQRTAARVIGEDIVVRVRHRPVLFVERATARQPAAEPQARKSVA